MKGGKLYPQGAFNANAWVEVYETILAATATSITISGLDGDAAGKYLLKARVVNGYNGNCFYGVRPNNDSGNNYGWQNLSGSDTSIAASRNTSWSYIYTGFCAALSDKGFSSILLHAKSGYVRTVLAKLTESVVTTTVTTIRLIPGAWNNTADNITSLVVFADQVGGLGIGTHIELWKPAYVT